MIQLHGDLFTFRPRVIAHGVNTSGVAGAGFAGFLRKKYPDCFNIYLDECKRQPKREPGWAVWAEVEGEGEAMPVRIWHLATQDMPGRYASVDWIAEAVATMLGSEPHNEIHIPQIGCGIGGLDWGDVAPILQDLDSHNRLRVCTL